MSATPNQIPIGTVATRIRKFQSSTDQSRNVIWLPAPHRSISEVTELEKHVAEAPRHPLEKENAQEIDEKISPRLQLDRFEVPLPNKKRSQAASNDRPYAVPFTTPSSTRAATSLGFFSSTCTRTSSYSAQRPSAIDCDGASEISVVRSQLRCSKPCGDQHPLPLLPTAVQEEGVLGELDSMIQNAINEQGAIVASKRAEKLWHRSSLTTTTNSPSSHSPTTSPRPQSPTCGSLGASLVTARHSMQKKNLSLDSSHIAVDEDITWPLPHGKVEVVQDQPISTHNLLSGKEKAQESFGRHQSPRSHEFSSPLSQEELIQIPPKLPVFPRYRSETPLRQDVDGQSLQSTHRADLPRAKINSPGRSEATRLTHRPVTRDSRASSCLLPLTLPRLVEESQSHNVHMEDNGDGFGRPQAGAKMWHLIESNKLNAGTSAAQTLDATAPDSRSPDHKTRPDGTGRKGPSIIESRIRKLLAAAGKPPHDHAGVVGDGKPLSKGRVKQTVLKENIRSNGDLDARTLPAYQLPVNQHAKLLHSEIGGLTPTKMKKFAIPSPMTPGGSPNAKSRPSSGSPLHQRSTQPCQPLSPRPSAYTFERRFALSPSRSQSRASQNAVRVSVEIRRSPERDRPEDQLLFVKASVEPEDSDGLDDFS